MAFYHYLVKLFYSTFALAIALARPFDGAKKPAQQNWKQKAIWSFHVSIRARFHCFIFLLPVEYLSKIYNCSERIRLKIIRFISVSMCFFLVLSISTHNALTALFSIELLAFFYSPTFLYWPTPKSTFFHIYRHYHTVRALEGGNA